MKREHISQVLEQIDTAYIEEATAFPGVTPKKNKLSLYISIAACMAVFLACTVWLILRNAASKDPGNWDIMMEHTTSQPTFSGSDSPSTESHIGSETSSTTDPTPTTHTDSTVPTEITESSTDPTAPTVVTDPPTEPTAPTIGSEAPTEGSEPPSSTDHDWPQPPNGSADGDWLDFATDSPISLENIPSLPADGGDFYLIQPTFSPLHSLEVAGRKVYPIYTDPYPIDHSGPQYEITEDLVIGAQQNLTTYLTLLLGTGNYTGTYNPDIPYALFYDSEELSIVAGKESLSVTSTAYDVYSTLTFEDLNTNPLFRAALSYSGITTPSISLEIEYDVNGEVYQYNYTITEHTEDPQKSLFNRTFSHITIRSYVDGGLLSFSLIHRGQSTEIGATTLATTKDIEDYLQKVHPDLAQKPHVTEVFYSSKVLTGYYVPSYRIFFVEAKLSEEYGAPAYKILELTDSRFLNYKGGI